MEHERQTATDFRERFGRRAAGEAFARALRFRAARDSPGQEFWQRVAIMLIGERVAARMADRAREESPPKAGGPPGAGPDAARGSKGGETSEHGLRSRLLKIR